MTTYGITWATPDHSVAQTGYEFRTVRQAKRLARKGPRVVEALGFQVDGMCDHYPAIESDPLYGRIESEDHTHGEVRTRTET